MKTLVGLRVKTYIYLIDDGSKDQKYRKIMKKNLSLKIM